MKKYWLLLLGFALFFLLFIQAVTVFIESIYILELLSTSLDEKVLGVLFLFSPVVNVVCIHPAPGREGGHSLPGY